MALSASTVWEVRTTGSDTNGGGFVTGASGTDWSQQDAAQYSVTDGVTAGTTTITSATANFGTDVVGNIMYVQGGTGSVVAGWYQITARTNSTTITVDRSTGLTAGTGVTLKIGGAFASPGPAVAVAVNGNRIYVKTGTYSITSTTQNISGGRLQIDTQVAVIGYGSSRDDFANPPTLIASGISSVYIVSFGNTFGQRLSNFILDGNSLSNVGGAQGGSHSSIFEYCRAYRCSTGFLANAYSRQIYRCYAESCTTGISFTCPVDCVTKNCTIGFTSLLEASNCIAIGGTTGFELGGSFAAHANRCLAYGCSGSGFSIGTNVSFGSVAMRCVATGCGSGFGGGVGINGHAAFIRDCAVYGNTINVAANVPAFNTTTLTADPFIDAANGDFRLNNTPGGGNTLRDLNFSMPGISTTRYPFGGWTNPVILVGIM